MIFITTNFINSDLVSGSGPGPEPRSSIYYRPTYINAQIHNSRCCGFMLSVERGDKVSKTI